MARTLLTGIAVLDGAITRADLNTTVAGSAVIRKIIAGTNVSLVSTGADAGTGDVTINVTGGAGDVVGSSPSVLAGPVLYNFPKFTNTNGKAIGQSSLSELATGELLIGSGNFGVAGRALDNQAALYTRQIADTLYELTTNDGTDKDFKFESSQGEDQTAIWQPPGGATTVPGVHGMAALTAVGTATTRAVATTNSATRAKRLGYVSAATAGALAGHYQTLAHHTNGAISSLVGGFRAILQFSVSDAAAVAGARHFCGMSSSVAAPTNVEPSALTNAIGIAQLSTDNTQWYLICAGSAAQAAVPMGVAFGAPTDTTALINLQIYCPVGRNGFAHVRATNRTNGQVFTRLFFPTTVGVQTPSVTTLLAYRNWRTNNATALAVGVDVSRVYIKSLDV